MEQAQYILCGIEGDTNLIGTHHMLIKDVAGDLINQRVCDPSAIVAVGDFSEFVLAYFIHRDLICIFITLDGNLGRHPANGSDLASETRRQCLNGIFNFQSLLVASLN